MVAGDVAYFMSGTYDYLDPDSLSGTYAFIYINNSNHNDGSAWNTISLAAYPGQLVQIGNGEEVGRNLQNFIYIRPPYLGYDSISYWTFSKFLGNLRAGMTQYSTGFNRAVYNDVRFAGCEIDTSFSTNGIGIGITMGGANNIKLLGNYFHHCGMGNAPATPTVEQGVGTGLTGTYKAIVTFFDGNATAGDRNSMWNETLPSAPSAEASLSNGSLRVTWSGLRTGSYDSITIWRTKAGGSTYYLDSTFIASTESGSVETTNPDSSLVKEIDFNGFNSTGYYRAGMPWYFGGYGTESNIEIAYNEVSYNYSGGQMFGHTSADVLDGAYIHHNYIHHNDRRAIGCVGGGDGGTYNHVTNAYIYDNIFYSNEGGIKLQAEPAGAGDVAHYYVFNNTFYKNDRYSGEIELWLIGNEFSTMEITNNIIVAHPNSYAYVSYSWGYNIGISGSNNIWYGKGNGPTWDTSPLNGTEPTFTNPTPTTFSDFQLQQSSVGVNDGTSDVSDVVTDDFSIISRPRGSAFDIGAFEYEEDIPSPGLPFIGSGGTFTLGTGGTIYLQ